MFSKELENLIQATLEDGVLEEYEKAALVKRATAEGVDITELEIYINSILQKRQRELNEKKNAEFAKVEQQKKEAFGKVCPACGKQVKAMTLRCECGYEFTNANAKAFSSIQRLNEKLYAVRLTDAEEREIMESDENERKAKRENYLTSKKIEIINTFPVPNTKEDIVEFLSVSLSLANKKLGYLDYRKNFFKAWGISIVLPAAFLFFLFDYDEWLLVSVAAAMLPIAGGLVAYKSKSFSEENMKKAWRAKFEQVLLKGRSLRGDAEFTQQLNYYEKMLKKE